MARKKAQAEESQAQETTHLYLSPKGELVELTDTEFLGDKQARGFVRAGDVTQDHLEDVEPVAEPESQVGQIQPPATNLEPESPKSDEPNQGERPEPDGENEPKDE